MADEPSDSEEEQLSSRAPEREDLISLCRELNARGARYVVIGGFAMILAGLPRTTGDVDLIIDVSLENEAKVFAALATLPDRAVLELKPGEVSEYTVVRVCDDITVDLMALASGIDYAEAATSVVMREIEGVVIPFASPELLWRMKSRTHREKDQMDIAFLRHWFASEGRTPPQV